MTFNYKTQQTLGWILLVFSLGFAAWVAADGYLRYQSLTRNDQQFHFSSNSDRQQADNKISLRATERANLFGKKPKRKKKKKTQVVVNAPKTRLNLKLTGILGPISPDIGYAVIEIKRGESTVVGIGDDIGKTGAKIHDIKSDHILINHRGKIEKLLIERPDLKLADSGELSQKTIKQLNLNKDELARLTQANTVAESSAPKLQSAAVNPVGATQAVEQTQNGPVVNPED